jgi:hypothetical protein
MLRVAEKRVRRRSKVISWATFEVVVSFGGGRKEPPRGTKKSKTERGGIRDASYWTSKTTPDSMREVLRITTPRGRTGYSGGSPALV